MAAETLHRKYLVRWLAAVLLLLLTVAGVNLLVDPYGLFDSRRIQGFNAIKPVAASHVRIAKPYQVLLFAPRTVIGGNSRPEIGLDPANPCWPSDSRPAFNLGLPGSSVYMQARLLQHAIAGSGANRVLWGLDFIDFMSPHRNRRNRWEMPQRHLPFEDRLSINSDGSSNRDYPWQSLVDHFQALGSLSATKDSLVTLLGQDNAYASSIRRDGFNPARDYLDIISWEGQNVLFQQKTKELLATFSRPGLNLYVPGTRWSGEFESVDRLLAFAGSRKVEVVLFINPYHIEYLAAIESTGNWDNLEQWKRQLAELAARSGVVLWDFSGIDHRTVEKVPPAGDRKRIMSWFWEPAHYRKRFGDLMLNRMLQRHCGDDGGVPAGVLLTPENIETELERSRKRFAEYLSESY